MSKLDNMINMFGIKKLECYSNNLFYVPGKIIEIYGKFNTGKRTFMLSLIPSLQKDFNILYIDYVHSFDKHYAEKLGININSLIIYRPKSESEFLIDIKNIYNKFKLIILDSLPCLEYNSYTRLVSLISKSKTCLIILNQLRENFKTKIHSYGSKKFKINTAIRIFINKKEYIKKQNEIIGLKIHYTITKNIYGIPFKEKIKEIYYN